MHVDDVEKGYTEVKRRIDVIDIYGECSKLWLFSGKICKYKAFNMKFIGRIITNDFLKKAEWKRTNDQLPYIPCDEICAEVIPETAAEVIPATVAAKKVPPATRSP